MKKLLFISAALISLASTAMAGNVTQEIPVTATVDPSCVFEGDAVPLTFHYTAANGVSDQMGGSTGTLHCNFGSINAQSPTVTVTKPDVLNRVDGSSAVLSVDLAVSAVEAYAGDPGSQYYGSDSRVYTVSASARTDQWTVPNADYAGIVTVSVDF
ncbi:hypothetical protein EHF33_13775 [Deinococcus psychrotolerans]|uniref:Spore coat protein U domain-containing protein n=1 Tax=Deinococcus psychrotolerans TaxID=2489213 RepID=A0A3G8YFD0_9DEIO|nr:hypothetical protein [Deinococcus psychrotolerans]AZI43992.1 hypothetical protein EHF33_13775 [Deinococcus psychrotolerans]